MPHWTEQIQNVKVMLVVAAITIAAASLVVSHYLVQDLEQEEHNRMEIWAEAMHSLAMADDNTDLNLVVKVMEQNNTIPVIVIDAQGSVQTFRNIDISAQDAADSLSKAAEIAKDMMQRKPPIKVVTGNGRDDFLNVCYADSVLLKRLEYYPLIQLGVVMLFVVIAIFALLTSKKAEQNKVWVGLSKETAHQLGTPISSLMAWTEILRETYPDDELIPEMDKDVKRLQLIADRFSKIGSAPEHEAIRLDTILQNVVDYMNRRTSRKVDISWNLTNQDIIVSVNRQLFEWVFENLCKNAVDAMEGHGFIKITGSVASGYVLIDVQDTGKGIERRNIKNVFRPGFTTKKRGWGLGLSLAKRIIEEYHSGRIYVLHSEIGKGTTFRIEIPASKNA